MSFLCNINISEETRSALETHLSSAPKEEILFLWEGEMTAEFQQQSPIISQKEPALYIAKKNCICFTRYLLLHNILKSHWKKTAWFSILKWHLTKYYQSSELSARKSSKLLVFPVAPKITTAMLSVPGYQKPTLTEFINSCEHSSCVLPFGVASDGLAYLQRHEKLLLQSIWTWQRKSMGLMENNSFPRIFNLQTLFIEIRAWYVLVSWRSIALVRGSAPLS